MRERLRRDSSRGAGRARTRGGLRPQTPPGWGSPCGPAPCGCPPTGPPPCPRSPACPRRRRQPAVLGRRSHFKIKAPSNRFQLFGGATAVRLDAVIMMRVSHSLMHTVTAEGFITGDSSCYCIHTEYGRPPVYSPRCTWCTACTSTKTVNAVQVLLTGRTIRSR